MSTDGRFSAWSWIVLVQIAREIQISYQLSLVKFYVCSVIYRVIILKDSLKLRVSILIHMLYLDSHIPNTTELISNTTIKHYFSQSKG